MSIKTIDREIKGTAGLAKKINKGAEKMVFDILQATQYSTPIPSTVRELVTNACDAQREKEIALEILTGKSTIEDYYIERHGEQYEDSNFDISYYTEKHLAKDKNIINISYEKHEGVGYCDRFIVADNGVGIGERRLEGVLELGYSTKRNTAENFGAFGLGAKVALSTGVDFYTVETVHNGKRFKCNCFNYKTDFIIPSFNIKAGQPNPHTVLSDGSKVFYEETDAPNGTTISFGVKRHNRSKFEDAVEEQLLYLDNITYTVIDMENKEFKEDHDVWSSRDVKFKANVIHNSENLIVSDTYVFNKPHIVLVKNPQAETGINYGFIDFRELEMETMWGPIAFKCPARQVINDPDTGEEIVLQEGVDVTPSREKVIWNDATKQYVLGVIKAAAKEASDIVQEELQETDFSLWIQSCRDILQSKSSDSVVGKIANIIDKEDLKPKYSLDKRLQFENVKSLFRGLDCKVISKSRDYRTGSDTIERDVMGNWDSWKGTNVFIKNDTSFSKYTDLYLHSLHGSFIVISDANGDVLPEKLKTMPDSDPNKAKMTKQYNKLIAKKKRVLELLEESESTQNYDDIEVPEEWVTEYKEEISASEEIAKLEHISPAERRELEKRMVAYTLREDTKRNDSKNYTWDKVEPKTKDLMQSPNLTYYGTSEDEGKFLAAAEILKKMVPSHKEVFPKSDTGYWDDLMRSPVFYFEEAPVRFRELWGTDKGKVKSWAVNSEMVKDWDTPQLLRVSQKYVRHVKQNPNYKHIDEFFLQLTSNGSYTMDEHLIKWYTAHKLDGIQHQQFLTGLQGINPELYDKFKTCYTLRDENYSRVSWARLEGTPLLKEIGKLVDFQSYCKKVEDAPDKDALISAYSRELFVVDVPDAAAFDQDMLDLWEEIQAFVEPVSPLLNAIGVLSEAPGQLEIDLELEKEIRVYLDAKDRLDWEY